MFNRVSNFVQSVLGGGQDNGNDGDSEASLSAEELRQRRLEALSRKSKGAKANSKQVGSPSTERGPSSQATSESDSRFGGGAKEPSSSHNAQDAEEAAIGKQQLNSDDKVPSANSRPKVDTTRAHPNAKTVKTGSLSSSTSSAADKPAVKSSPSRQSSPRQRSSPRSPRSPAVPLHDSLREYLGVTEASLVASKSFAELSYSNLAEAIADLVQVNCPLWWPPFLPS